MRNTFIIFLVSGFWHGASWNYIVWGGIHACGFLPLLLLNRNRKHVDSVVAIERKLPNLKELMQMVYTFSFVTFAWIFFRISSVNNGIDYIKQIFVNSFGNPRQFIHSPDGLTIFYYIIPLIVMDWWFRRDERKIAINKFIAIILCVLIVDYMANQYYSEKKSEFIYFQF